MNIFRNARFIACTVFVVLFSTVAAFYSAFVSLAPYDDEGTMMWALKLFFQGSPLYDQVATIYGPMYYFYQWCAHVLTGTPVSHHSVRLVSIALWVAAALLVFLLTYRTTGSLLLASLTHILAFRAMAFIGEEPAHAQEACIFLLVALGLTCFARNRTWRFAMIGVITGLIVLTKINLGIFAIIALLTGFAYSLRPKSLRIVASGLASVGMLVFPVLLMSGHIREWWAQKYCALVILSLAAALVTVVGNEWDIHVDFRDLFIAGMGFAGAIAAICWFALAHGSTMHAMIYWLVIRPRASFGQAWYLPAPITLLAPLWALITLGLACSVRTGHVPAAFLAYLKVAFAVAVIALCAGSGYEILLNFAPPLLWLAAARSPKDGWATHESLARVLLLLLSVLQILYAYPVGGSQNRFTTILMIVAATICLSDGIGCLGVPSPGDTLSRWAYARPVRWAACLFLGATYLGMAWQRESIYASFELLGLPGTSFMRVTPKRAAALRALVGRVNASACRTLITEPGMFSFNLFTGKPVPDGLHGGGWMLTLSAAEQEGIVRQVAQDPDACVIRSQDMVDLWTRRRDVSSQPLVRYLHEHFRSDFEVADYSFLVPKD